jgi:hypothetical protein
MGKLKLMAIIVAGLFIGISAASAGEMNGEIHTTIDKWVGIVAPQIDMDNQSVTLNVDIEGEGENLTYRVNDTLKINLNNTLSESARESYVLPRSIFYGVFMYRQLTDLFPLFDGTGRGLLTRILPVFQVGGAQVSEAMIGEEVDNITINCNYVIRNTTFEEGENLTMAIFAVGMLPGEVNGIHDDLPIVQKKIFTVEVDYE